MKSKSRIGIVGAGLAGLTAAYRLQKAGARVAVFESADGVGGRTRTEVQSGCRIDPATQLFGSMYTGVRELVREMELERDWYRSSGRDALWRGGRAHEVVYGSVPSMLASGGLPLRTKIRLGTTYLPYLTRHGGLLDLHELYRAAAGGLDSESIGAWGEREIGRDFVDYLVYPLLASYYGSDPSETVSALYHLLARQGMDVTVHALRRGAGSLCDALAARIQAGGGEVRLGAAVRRVEAVEGGVRVTGGGEAWTESFDGAVVATTASVARDLLSSVNPRLGRWLEGVRYGSAVSVSLLLDRPVGVRYFGLSFPRDESRTIAAVCVEENKVPGLVPAGKGALVVFAAPSAAPDLIGKEARAVANAFLPDLARAFPGIEKWVQHVTVHRWTDGNAIFYPGYLEHLTRFHTGDLEGDASIVIAGDYLRFPNTEGAVTSGRAAADRLLGRLSA